VRSRAASNSSVTKRYAVSTNDGRTDLTCSTWVNRTIEKEARRSSMAAAREKRVLSFFVEGTKANRTTCKTAYVADVICLMGISQSKVISRIGLTSLGV
jgi:hypothetical protein